MFKQLSFLPIGGKSNQFRFGFVLLLSAFLICLLLIGKNWLDVPYKTLLLNPLMVSEEPLYTGIFFQIGISFWAASITVCFFVSKILSSRAGRARMSNFLFVSGMISLVFCLNEVFPFHKHAADFMGVPEIFILPGYGAFLMLYLISYYSLIFKTDYALLGTAFFFYGLSLAIGFMDVELFDPILIGGLAKMIGIVSWMVYFFRLGKNALLFPTIISKSNKLEDISSDKPLHHHYN